MTKLQIECLIAAVNSRSLTKAGRHLFLSVQSVSQHIQTLEKEVGFEILVRTNQGVALTERGEIFYAKALRWVRLFEGTQKKIREHYASLSASFRIGISEYVDVLGRISSGIVQFRKSHEDVMFSGQHNKNTVLLEELYNGNLDVVIINDKQISAGSDIEFMAFAKEDLRLCISGVPLERKDSGQTVPDRGLWAACQDLPHISTSYGIWNEDDWEEITHRRSSSLGHVFRRHFETENLLSAVINLQFIPCSVVSDARFGYPIPETGVIRTPLETESYLCCLWHRKNENPLIPEFVEHMKSFYQAD